MTLRIENRKLDTTHGSAALVFSNDHTFVVPGPEAKRFLRISIRDEGEIDAFEFLGHELETLLERLFMSRLLGTDEDVLLNLDSNPTPLQDWKNKNLTRRALEQRLSAMNEKLTSISIAADGNNSAGGKCTPGDPKDAEEERGRNSECYASTPLAVRVRRHGPENLFGT